MIKVLTIRKPVAMTLPHLPPEAMISISTSPALAKIRLIMSSPPIYDWVKRSGHPTMEPNLQEFGGPLAVGEE